MSRPRRRLLVGTISLVGLLGGLLAWSIRDPNPPPRLTIRLTPPVRGSAFTVDGATFRTTDATGPKVWDLTTGQVIPAAMPPALARSGMSRDGRRYATWSIADQAVVWGDVAPRQIHAQFPVALADDTLLPSLSWINDDRQIQLITTQPGWTSVVAQVFTWDVASGQETRQTVQGPGPAFRRPTAFTADGRTWIYQNPGQDTFQLWDARADQPIGAPLRVPGSSRPAAGVGAWSPAAFAPDGQTVMTGLGDGRIACWDVTRQQLQRVISALPAGDHLQFMNISPDGRTLAVSGSLPQATTWPAQVFFWVGQWLTGKNIRELTQQVVLIDLETGQPLARLDRVNFGGFSRDGRRFMTDDLATTIRVYDVPIP